MLELCIHIYDPANTHRMLNKLKPFLDRTQRIFITTPHSKTDIVSELLNQVTSHPNVIILGVDNAHHDWSGYLAMLAEATADGLIFCNDSLINRRLIRKADIKQLIDLLEAATRPSLIGELDTARISVPIAGYSSSSWVSSFLFGLRLGHGVSAASLGRLLANDYTNISEQTKDTFLSYLRQHRQDLLNAYPDGGGKLRAMYLERLLTHHVSAHQFDIVSQYGGNWNRKIYRLIESHML